MIGINFPPLSTDGVHSDLEEEEEDEDDEQNTENTSIKRRKDPEFNTNRFKFKPFEDNVIVKNILEKVGWSKQRLSDLNWNEISDLRDIGEA